MMDIVLFILVLFGAGIIALTVIAVLVWVVALALLCIPGALVALGLRQLARWRP